MNRDIYGLKVSCTLRFADRRVDPLERVIIRLVDIEVGLLCSYRPSRERDSLDHQMRSMFYQNAVLEAAGLVLTRVANDVSRSDRRFGSDGPLPSNRKTGASPASETRESQLPKNIGRCEILAHGFVAT